jgi:hypothetical protein
LALPFFAHPGCTNPGLEFANRFAVIASAQQDGAEAQVEIRNTVGDMTSAP